MILSKEIRELKQTTGTEASIFVVTKDNKLYCVNGQHRFQDMRAHVFDTNVSNDEMGESESKTLDSSVHEDESQCTFNRQIGTMSQEEDLEKALTPPHVVWREAFDAATLDATGDGRSSNVDRDGSATTTVSCAFGSRLGRSGIRHAC
ncbi:unnamed protein product [Prunus armeniaca]|uniref:Uncharacterized protein n=1 Tax=Prunus armeniaca TaxID=36596 RepID=A0A6J5TZF0_PRUAR|nr:unnamed protein product [Prunus armeniaca]CAB4299084.1 unnamed protein product [Prunus armeniaca]